MSTNPYAPPRTRMAESDAPKVARPVSAWLLQLASAIFVAGMFWAIATTVARIVTADRVRWSVVGGYLVVDAAILAWCLVAFVGTQRRANIGRRLGIALIVGFFALYVVTTVRTHLANEQRGLADPFGAADAVRTGIGLLVCAAWCFHFGFSKASRAWFKRGREPA